MKLNEMSWPHIKSVAEKSVAILPIAAIEQHGPQLTVSTDSTIVTALAERVESSLREEVVLCPTLSFGSSNHHFGFPGTLSIGHETYARVLVDLAASLVESGFRRIVLLNGHGGNIVPGNFALSLLSQRFDDTIATNIALATYWELGGEAFAGAGPMETPGLSHACEYETSLMLHLYPSRVELSNAQRAQRPPHNPYIGWESEAAKRGVSMSKKTHFISSNGSSGQPQLATAEKGEHLFRKAVAVTTEFIQDFRTWPLLHDLR